MCNEEIVFEAFGTWNPTLHDINISIQGTVHGTPTWQVHTHIRVMI